MIAAEITDKPSPAQLTKRTGRVSMGVGVDNTMGSEWRGVGCGHHIGQDRWSAVA